MYDGKIDGKGAEIRRQGFQKGGEPSLVATVRTQVAHRVGGGCTLTVTGHDLVVKGLDLEGGRLLASGYVTSMRYSTAPSPGSIVRRIFK